MRQDQQLRLSQREIWGNTWKSNLRQSNQVHHGKEQNSWAVESLFLMGEYELKAKPFSWSFIWISLAILSCFGCRKGDGYQGGIFPPVVWWMQKKRQGNYGVCQHQLWCNYNDGAWTRRKVNRRWGSDREQNYRTNGLEAMIGLKHFKMLVLK